MTRRAWRVGLLLGVALLLLLTGLLLARPLRDFARIDRCLDRGGSWNHDARVCDLERSHPSQPSSPD